MRAFHSLFILSAVCILSIGGMVVSSFAEGILTVKTDPDGIEVWLGDKFLGQSPIIEKKIRAGRYVLKLVDPAQHTSATEELLIQDNEPLVIDRAISSKFGRLKVTSDPDGADVYIATELGKTPLSNDFMNPGRYHIEIRPPNGLYQTAVSEVTIPKGETVTIDKKLGSKLFSTRNLISFGLLAISAGGFAIGLIEQGHCGMYQERMKKALPSDKSALQDKIDGASLDRTLGVVIGAAGLLGLEIVVLF
jgi:PEGA domain